MSWPCGARCVHIQRREKYPAHNLRIATAWKLNVCVIDRHSVVNTIGACAFAIDAVSTGLLAASAIMWEGTSRETQVNDTIFALEMFALIGE